MDFSVLELPEAALPIFDITAVILGACIGSFLNVVILRLPARQSLWSPPSHCPGCGHRIRPWENVPVISWLALRARCSACRHTISWRYPLIEACTGIVFFLLWRRVSGEVYPLQTLPALLFLASWMIAAGIIDLEHRIIPDRINMTGIIAAVVLAVILPYGQLQLSTVGSGVLTVLPETGSEWNGDLLDYSFLRIRLAAGINLVLGVAAGTLPLLLLRWSGGRLWGKSRNRPESGGTARLLFKKGRFELNSLQAEELESYLKQGKHIVLQAQSLEGVTRDGTRIGSNERHSAPSPQKSVLRISSREVRIDQKRIPVSQLERLVADISEWSLPREVLGLGDVKLMAVAGAFAGPQGVLMIIFLSSFSGCCAGVLLWLAKKLTLEKTLSFGPFITLGTLVWLLAGERVMDIFLIFRLY